MCIYKIKIQPKYWRHEIYVSCGHCPACLQEKANRRASRIRNEIDSEKFDVLFVTLDYENRYIPYIFESDLIDFIDGHDVPEFFGINYSLQVLRDNDVRYIYNRHSKEYIRKDIKSLTTLSDLHYSDFETSTSLDYKAIRNCKYKFIRRHDNRFNAVEDGKISVIYKKDVQDFIKRYRSYLKRNGYDFETKIFATSEYGPTTHRAHHHLCMSVPKGLFSVAETAILKSWHFCNMRRPIYVNGKKHFRVERAKSPSKYLAEYVNCDASIQGILKDSKPFRPKHSYSQHYGFNKKDFTFDSVTEKVRRGALFYDCTINRDGVPTPAFIPYPKYVISYYFPKFKGYNNLASHEIADVVYKPQRIFKYKELLNLTRDDCNHFIVSMINKRDYICSKYGLDPFVYASLFPKVWNVYKSSLLRWFHYEMLNPLESYDNIEDFFKSTVSSLIRRNEFIRPYFLESFRVGFHYETDPNNFQDNLRHDDYLRHMYYERSKDKKTKEQLTYY